MTWLRERAGDFSWLWFVLRRRMKQKWFAAKRLFIKPKLPVNSDGKVLVHLGCGDVNSPEFINVDARPAPHVHCA